MKLRILHVAFPGPVGGLEQVVHALAAGHRRAGHDVGVALVTIEGSERHPLVVPLQEAGVRVFEVRVGHRAYVRERREVTRICREFRPHVVHTHGYRADVIDRGAAAKLGIPTVTTVHGPSMIGGLKGAFYEWLQRRNYARYDAVVAVSAKLRETTLGDGVAPTRLHLIPNAWGGLHDPVPRDDARRALGLPLDATIVGWVGRFIPVKAGEVFLEAMGRLLDTGARIALIGRGPELDALRAQAARLGLTDRLSFHLEVNNAGRLFRAFDVYVLSSRSEGLPVVILEAMAAQTPIVSTSVGGIPDVLGADEALLVAPDDPAALAAAIRSSLEQPDDARRRAIRAEERLRREFALEPWLEKYEQVYRAIIAREPAQAVPAAR